MIDENIISPFMKIYNQCFMRTYLILEVSKMGVWQILQRFKLLPRLASRNTVPLYFIKKQ